MPGDALAGHIDGEGFGNERRKLIENVAAHAEMFGPWRLRGIEIEAGALAKVIGRSIGDALAARRGIGADDKQAEFGGEALILAFFHDIGVCAGEAGEEPQHRAGAGLRRDIGGEGHRRAG